jgi:proteic killer suppression protein
MEVVGNRFIQPGKLPNIICNRLGNRLGNRLWRWYAPAYGNGMQAVLMIYGTALRTFNLCRHLRKLLYPAILGDFKKVKLYLVGFFVEISYKSKKLEALCDPRSPAHRKLGKDKALKLKNRVTDLRAALSVSQLSAGRPHPLVGNRAGQFALDLVHPERLVFEPDHELVPQTEDGGIDWSRVTRVVIIWIGDYHD